MTLWNLGSIDADHVYALSHLPRAGETLAARSLSTGLGGKGTNMSRWPRPAQSATSATSAPWAATGPGPSTA